jgi:hypothetical protein
MRTLVAGWFSFERMGATAGDLMTRDLVCQWLRECAMPYDVALAPPFTGGVDWRAADPANYSHVLFVCGPFGNGEPVIEFLARFKGRQLIGVNLTMLDPLEDWNPFDLLIERDSSRCARPDLAFLSTEPRVPVAGLVLIHPQPEYAERDLHREANRSLRDLAKANEVAVVPIDTRLDENLTGLKTQREIESLIAGMDLVLTTRLHGFVLALKNGVPVIAVDPVAGGAKISRQARLVGWPLLFQTEEATPKRLQEAFDFCNTREARSLAIESSHKAKSILSEARETFIQKMSRRD